MGPFELLDVVGNDVSLAIQRELYLEFREPGFAPAPLLEHLVTAGYLGRKTKRGFRDYTSADPVADTVEDFGGEDTSYAGSPGRRARPHLSRVSRADPARDPARRRVAGARRPSPAT